MCEVGEFSVMCGLRSGRSRVWFPMVFEVGFVLVDEPRLAEVVERCSVEVEKGRMVFTEVGMASVRLGILLLSLKF